MLWYHQPFTTCAAFAALSVLLPDIGVVKPVGTTMPADSNGLPGPWKCAAKAALVRPPNVMFHVICSVAGSRVTVPVPLPPVGMGLPCVPACAPSSNVLYCVLVSCAS